MSRVSLIYIFIMLLFTTPAHAKMYKCTLANGKITFTDQGCSKTYDKNVGKLESEVIIEPISQKMGDSRFKWKSSGTAWVISDSYVVTNHHVVDGHRNFRLVDSVGKVVPATLVKKSREFDLAILQVRGANKLPKALKLGYLPVRVGEKVFTIGYPDPLRMGLSSKMTEGSVSSLYGVGGKEEWYQISVPLQHGNSGGPLLNMRGEVVGVVNAGLKEAKYENVSYAIKETVLTRFLPKGLFPQKQTASLPKHASLPDLVEGVEASVLLIICD